MFSIYTYDTRNLKTPVNIHMDHVSAVTSIDYSPTGREFVTGSYDKTIRIFEISKVNIHKLNSSLLIKRIFNFVKYFQGHSRDIYHTKRMQHVTNVCWTLDNKYVISASDEMNIRIWKARASEKLGVVSTVESLRSFVMVISLTNDSVAVTS